MSHNKLTRATQEPAWVRRTLLAVGLGFLFFFLGLPLLAVFVEALAQGLPVYLEALQDPETRSAIWLTVVIALAVLPFNILFGVAAARRPDLHPALRRPGLFRTLAGGQ